MKIETKTPVFLQKQYLEMLDDIPHGHRGYIYILPSGLLYADGDSYDIALAYTIISPASSLFDNMSNLDIFYCLHYLSARYNVQIIPFVKFAQVPFSIDYAEIDRFYQITAHKVNNFLFMSTSGGIIIQKQTQTPYIKYTELPIHTVSYLSETNRQRLESKQATLRKNIANLRY